MPSILTKKYRTFLARTFKNSFANSSQFVYAFIGRPQEWADTSNVAVSDTNPPAPVNSIQEQSFENWRDMLGVKRIPSANTYLVIPRNNWSSNSVYAQYDDQNANLYAQTFYVVDTTSVPLKVYKCLWNNKDGASNVAPSTIGTSTSPVATADGYVWQYMYTITSDLYPFLTSAWMPVLANSDVQTAALANAGKLPTAVPLIVENGGSGYNASVNVVTTIIGDGSGATVANSGATVSGGEITGLVLSAGGSGYSEVESINVYQSGATAATVRAIIPPYPNHGYDPESELGVAACMITTQLEFDESGKLTVQNNYRRVGVIVNPLLANGSLANSSFHRQTFNMVVASNTGVFSPDDEIYNETNGANPTAIVVDVQPDGNATPILRLTAVHDKGQTAPFTSGDTLKCNATGVEYVIGTVSDPELLPFSGDILYCDQRVPVTRANDQVEEIKLVFQLG